MSFSFCGKFQIALSRIDSHSFLSSLRIVNSLMFLVPTVSVMKQQQSKEAIPIDKKQTNIGKEQTNTHLRAKRELRKPHYLEDFVTSFGSNR